ncbi:MAG TPA: ABC transporter permease [Catenuloplanes sp.]
MIALVLAMMAARRGQTVVVLLLSVFATGAAVAGPVYLAAVDRAALAAEVAAADRFTKTVSLSLNDAQSAGFDSLAPKLLTMPGFRQVHSLRFPVLGVEPAEELSTVTFRSQVCQHLTIVAGRCLMGPAETVVGEATAARLGLSPGATTTVSWAQYDEVRQRFVAAGAPAVLSVVGVYRPRDPGDLYWGRSRFFGPGVPDAAREPLFVNRQSADVVEHSIDERTVEAMPEADTLGPDRLSELRAHLAQVETNVRGTAGSGNGGNGSYAALDNRLGPLLDRLDRARAVARQVVPLAVVPLVALCWFVIFLAVAYGTTARRPELALLALRGLRGPARWWLTAAESTGAILLGAPVGFLAGVLGVSLVARARLGVGPGTGQVWGAWPFALVAVGGAVLAGLLAQRRELGSPVAELLRRVPSRRTAWRSVAGEAVVVALAVAATVQLRGFDGELVGLSLLLPALVAAAVAVVTGRLVLPVAGRLGALALRRGRLGPALGALELSRRPGGHRLLVLLTVVVALLVFGATAVDVAANARGQRAAVISGAARTVTVRPVDGAALLAAVRTAEPTGRYAMAAAVVQGTPDSVALLAVDSARLERVVPWRADYGSAPGPLAVALHPPAGVPFTLRGDRLTVDVDTPADLGTGRVELTVRLRPPAGQPPVTAEFGQLRAGRHSYLAAVPGCAVGCRVAAVEVSYRRFNSDVAQVVLHELRGTAGTAPVVSSADFATAGRWRPVEEAEIAALPDGLRVAANSTTAGATVIVPVDAPYPLPAVVAGGAGERVQGIDTRAQRVSVVAGARVLPRLGDRGALVDLEYADQGAPAGVVLTDAQVWLTAEAPPDILRRLTDAGLTVVDDRSVADIRASLDGQAPALAIWFYLLAAGLAVVLALGGVAVVAAVDRRRVGEDLESLRRQGLPAGVATRAALWANLSVVAVALVAGALAGAAGWLLAGAYLPLFLDAQVPLAPPRWPRPAAVLLPWLGCGILLTAAVSVAAVRRAGPAHPRASGGTTTAGRRWA